MSQEERNWRSGMDRAAHGGGGPALRVLALAALAAAAFGASVLLHRALPRRAAPPVGADMAASSRQRPDPTDAEPGASPQTALPPVAGRAFKNECEGLRPRSDAPWRVPEAEYRQLVELELLPVQVSKTDLLAAGAPAPPSTARCELRFARALGGDSGVRVFDSSGRELSYRLRALPGDGAAAELVIDLAGAQGPFEVYYPVRGARPPEPSDDAVGGGLRLAVWHLAPGRAEGLHRLHQVVAALKEARSTGESRDRRQIDDRASPFGRHDHYVAVYQGWLACPTEGIYTFGLDADDRAFLLLDGEEVLAGGAPGHLPPQSFAFRSARPLRPGLHALTFYHVQGTGALRARLAWQPPGSSRMRVVPPSAFAAHIPARAVALERREGAACEVFFSASLRRRLVVNGDVPVTEWELAASGPRRADATGGLAWVWREGERILGEGPRLRLFVSGLPTAPGADPRGAPYRRVALSLECPSGELGRYTADLGALGTDALEDEPLAFRLELGSAPVFLYPHEPFEVHVHAINDSEEPVTLEALEVVSDEGRSVREVRPLGEFALPAVGPPGNDVLAKRMNRLRRRFAAGEAARLGRLAYWLGLPGAPAEGLEIVFLSSRAGVLPPLSAREGALWIEARTAEPRRVGISRRSRAIVVLPYDTDSDLRRWAFLKGLSPLASAFSGVALYYGDPLESEGALGGEGLEHRLRRVLETEGLALKSVRFPAGEYPIHAAAAGADGAFARVRARRIWVSPGLGDASAGTPLHEFERGLDFIIDRARTLAPGSKLVLVGPPPEWGRPVASARYADAAKAVAEQHGIAYVDIHAMLSSPELLDSAYRESGPDDGVRFRYPLGEAMERIAREAASR